MLASILAAYGFKPHEWIIQPFGTGLINDTWLIKKDDEEYILQRINHNVFKDPYAISNNIRSIGNYLQQYFPGYFFVMPIQSTKKQDIVQSGEDFYRIFPFVKDSVTYTSIESPELAFEAARQFGRFTEHLSGFNESILQETIPNFHNLSLRYNQFQDSLKQGNEERVQEATDVVKQLEKYRYIVDEFEQIKINPQFKKRVMHHDTKISNVLFDRKTMDYV
jgi:hypothetical protein